VFTVIGRNTRWFEAFPLSDITTKSCLNILVQGWIARYGELAVITLDWGSQFTLVLWDSLCSMLGIKHMQTTAYHPHATGLVKRFHRRLKDTLLARLAGGLHTSPGCCWACGLPNLRKTTSLLLFLAHPSFCRVNFLMLMHLGACVAAPCTSSCAGGAFVTFITTWAFASCGRC
jgi:transposase InsO family protein